MTAEAMTRARRAPIVSSRGGHCAATCATRWVGRDRRGHASRRRGLEGNRPVAGETTARTRETSKLAAAIDAIWSVKRQSCFTAVSVLKQESNAPLGRGINAKESIESTLPECSNTCAYCAFYCTPLSAHLVTFCTPRDSPLPAASADCLSGQVLKKLITERRGGEEGAELPSEAPAMDLDGETEAAIMAKAWEQLRLAVRAPSRFAAWDAILITAASPSQAGMYTW